MKGKHGNKGSYGPMSGSGQKSVTKGSVEHGLSDKSGFHAESLEADGLNNASGRMNQVPKHPKKKISCDRGTFTFW